MPKKKAVQPSSPQKRRAALTPEQREQQLVGLAMDVAEEQLRNGTASAQVITHFLKLGTTRAELETEKLRKENNLMEAKANSIVSAESQAKLYENALKAFTVYSGTLHREDADDQNV